MARKRKRKKKIVVVIGPGEYWDLTINDIVIFKHLKSDQKLEIYVPGGG